MKIKLSRKSNKQGFKLNEQEIQNCIDLYKYGLSVNQISKKLKISSNMIASALKRNNIKLYPRNSRKKNVLYNNKQLFIDYKNGKSLEKLSKIYSLCPQSIKKILIDKKIYQPPINKKITMSEEHLNRAIQLAGNGVPYKLISKELGYSIWIVHKSLYNVGIRRKKSKQTLSTYQAHVRRLSNKNYYLYKNLINPHNLPRGKNEYHLDHIYSVYEGFINNVPVHIVAHPLNLQMLESYSNIVKRDKSQHTLEELMIKIKNFKT